jgi:hypothetical protein
MQEVQLEAYIALIYQLWNIQIYTSMQVVGFPDTNPLSQS